MVGISAVHNSNAVMSENSFDFSIIDYYAENEGYRCGYCKSPDTNYSHGMLNIRACFEGYLLFLICYDSVYWFEVRIVANPIYNAIHYWGKIILLI